MKLRLIGCFAAGLAALSLGCTTSVYKDGKELTREEIAQQEAAEEEDGDTPDSPTDARIRNIVEAVGYDRGAKLLRDLQWLIGHKELAVPAIVQALPKADLRTRANLLYVLGFTRTTETTEILAENLGHADPVVRFEAAAGLLNHGDSTAVPVLVDFLEDADKRVRYKAFESLKAATGLDMGYNFNASEELRAPAVAKWRTWWGEEKQRLMYRPWDERTAGTKGGNKN